MYSLAPRRIGREYVVIYGRRPEIQLLFRGKLLHDHALWMLKLANREHNRWMPWWNFERWWRERPWSMAFFELGARDRALGWLLARWLLWRMLRAAVVGR